MGRPKEYIDVQLAHGQNNTDAAYFHTKFLPQRREMMQAWADYLDGLETAAS
jgi:integrase family protein